MNALIPFAHQQLSKHREFYPFGGTMSVDGKITQSASSTGEQRPASQPLIDLLEKGFQDGAKRRLYKATAIIVDVRTIPPGKTEKQDAIEVRLDHVSGYSVKVLFSYAFSPKGDLQVAPLSLFVATAEFLAGRQIIKFRNGSHSFGFERTGTNSSKIATVALELIMSSPVGVHGLVFIVATDEPYAKTRYFVPALNT